MPTMTETEIIADIRQGIREPQPRTVSNETLSATILQAVDFLGLQYKKFAPLHLQTRKSLQSNTNIFAFPSDCDRIIDVWDLNTNAGTITDATNATPIVVTCATHGFEDDDIVTVHDVGGNTAANGTWKVANATTNTFELYGSVGNAVYTSGGKVFAEPTNLNELRMERIPEGYGNLDDPSNYFLRHQTIVVDDADFSNDIIVAYTKTVTAITDILGKHHIGLVAFGVIKHIRVPGQDQPGFVDLQQSLQRHKQTWQGVLADILSGSQQAVQNIGSSNIKTKGSWI